MSAATNGTDAKPQIPLKKGYTHTFDAKKHGFKYLSQEDADHFLEKGYVVLRGAIPEPHLKMAKETVWVRLGMDENDKNTWTKEEIHMPRHKMWHAKDFAPKVWGAMSELMGGEDRVDYKTASWGDSFICNLGNPEYDPEEVIDPRDLGPWHVDGDWFRHFLDAENQALECLVLYSDVEERAGPTYIATDGIGKVAKWLLEHPEGSEDMCDPEGSGNRIVPQIVRECKDFVTLTGKTGDVFLCHFLTPHSRSRNHIRNSRFIINPFVSFAEPQQLKRENPDDYSLIELKTLHDLDCDWIDFKPTRERYRFLPRTKAKKDALINEEIQRLKEWEKKTGQEYTSMHENGIVYWQAPIMGLSEA